LERLNKYDLPYVFKNPWVYIFLMNNDENSILIYDIESSTIGSRPNPRKDEFRLFGCYSYKTNKYHFLTKPRQIKQIIIDHKFLVGFNNKEFDNVMLARMQVVADSDVTCITDFFDKSIYQGMYTTNKGKCGFKGKITIDLMEIFKKRAGAMKIKDGILSDLLMHFSLAYIAKTIKLGSYKDENFDYTLLQEPVELWSPEKLKKVLDYTRQDLLVTKEMYEWLEEYFGSFKDFVSQENIDNKSYLTCSTAVFAYKCLCKELDIKEEYGEAGLNKDFGGGFVALPTVLEEHGNILLFDFTSLYPNLFIMGNLFGNNCICCTEEEKWSGDGFFKVEGKYCSKQLAPLGTVLKKFYLMRIEMKKNNDPREYSIKIIINAAYGIVCTSTFQNIYNPVAGSDCTYLGRTFIRYTRKRFRNEGYKLLLTDTDSISVKLPNDKTKEEAQILADNVTKELLSHMPFPW